jgi:hypothetical protein
MADKITLEIVGMRELQLGIERWGDYLVEQAQAELSNVVDEALAEMRRDVAVHSGQTKKQIKATLSAMGILATLRSRSGASHLLEWGTKKREFAKPHVAQVAPGVFRWVKHAGEMPKKPFFVKVIVEARKRFFKRMKNLLGTPIPELGPGRPEVRET